MLWPHLVKLLSMDSPHMSLKVLEIFNPLVTEITHGLRDVLLPHVKVERVQTEENFVTHNTGMLRFPFS